jgi:hypothetical protein
MNKPKFIVHESVHLYLKYKRELQILNYLNKCVISRRICQLAYLRTDRRFIEKKLASFPDAQKSPAWSISRRHKSSEFFSKIIKIKAETAEK